MPDRSGPAIGDTASAMAALRREVTGLRGVVRDLVALSALPAAWVAREPPEIAGSALDVLLRALNLDVGYARLHDPGGGAAVDVVRTARSLVLGDATQGLRQALDPWLRAGDAARPPSVALRHRTGAVTLRVVRAQVGLEDEYGVVVACSRRRDFPTDLDRLLLQTTANQMAISLKGARLMGALRHADRLKAELLAREQAARAEAEAAVRARDAFLARAAHELRTPLTSALGTIRWLTRAMRGGVRESPEDLAEMASRNLVVMAALVNDLLDASKLAAGEEHLVRAPVDLADVLRRSVDLVAPQARDKQVAVRVAVPAGLVLSADALKIEQVAVNLLANAVKFTPPSGEVVVEAAGEGDTVHVRVRDNGTGIAPEHLERVFEPFFQGERREPARSGRGRSRRGRGSGLGLAICRQIVTLHGGRIWAESEGPGRGSVFVVALPLAAAGSRAVGRPAPR